MQCHSPTNEDLIRCNDQAINEVSRQGNKQANKQMYKLVSKPKSSFAVPVCAVKKTTARDINKQQATTARYSVIHVALRKECLAAQHAQ
jgi:hypothetical protein